MVLYNKYNIKDSDRFVPGYFIKAEDELKTLLAAIAGHHGPFTELIVLSYLKFRSLKTEWIDANPWLSAFMTANTCSTGHMESLFVSSKDNTEFSREYEDHIRKLIASLPLDTVSSS